MNPTEDSITFAPRFDNLLAGVAALMCVVLTGSVMVDMLRYGNIKFGFVMATLTGYLLWLTANSFLMGVAEATISSKGIVLTVLGRTIRSYPAERLRTGCIFDQDVEYDVTLILCISTLSVSELAARREKQLRRNPYMRSNIQRRKQGENWKNSFAREYLRKKIKVIWWNIPDKEVFGIPMTVEGYERVRKILPQLSWENMIRRTPYADKATVTHHEGMYINKEESPDRFLQCNYLYGLWTIQEVLWVFCPFMVLFFLTARFINVFMVFIILIAACFGWLFASVAVQEQLARKRWISLCPEGIYLFNGKKAQRFFHREEIKSVFICIYVSKTTRFRYLMISDKTCSEIAREMIDRQMIEPDILKVRDVMENWEAFVAQQQMDRELSRKSFRTEAAIVMSWSPEREKWLRDRYPAAVWVEPLNNTEYFASKL